MNIFKDFDKFTIFSKGFMKNNRGAVLRKYPNSTADETAARVARAHNGGIWQRTLAQLTSASFDTNNYVKRFIGMSGYTKEGDWNSIRCVDNLIGEANVEPGANGKGLGCLEIEPLTFPRK